MKRFIIVFATIFISSLGTTSAQDYNTSLGVGLGPDLSVNFKHFLSEKSALELQGSANLPVRAAMFSLVYQYNVYLTDGLNFYVGGGFNIGALYLNHRSTATFAVGFSPTVGFEYSFNSSPIALAVDYKPNINFTTVKQWNLVAFKIRFTW